MKMTISKNTSNSNQLFETARVATLALTVTMLMVGVAYLLSALKQVMFG